MVWFRLWLILLPSWTIYKMIQWGMQTGSNADDELRGVAVWVSLCVFCIGFVSFKTLKAIYQDAVHPWYKPLKRWFLRTLRVAVRGTIWAIGIALRWLFVSLPRVIWNGYQAAPKALLAIGLTIVVMSLLLFPVCYIAFQLELPFVPINLGGTIVGMLLSAPAAGILISRIGTKPAPTHLTLLPRRAHHSMRKVTLKGGGDAA